MLNSYYSLAATEHYAGLLEGIRGILGQPSNVKDLEGVLWYKADDGYHVIARGLLVPYDIGFTPVTPYEQVLDVLDMAQDERLPVTIHIDSYGGFMHPYLEKIMRKLMALDSLAVIEGNCASAAYLMARACNRVIASGVTNDVGGIGAFIAFYDVSARNRENGLKPIVIRTGKRKGVGYGGEYSEDDIIYIESRLLATFKGYMDLLADKNIPIEAMDGSVYPAYEALGMGLIDEILPFKQLGDSDMSGDEVVELEASEPEQKAVEPVVERLPVIRACDDSEDDKTVFDNLVKRYGSKTRAWSVLRASDPERYNRLLAK